MRLFELLVHVEATPDQPLDNCVGAYAICYVPAPDIPEAVAQAEHWLAEEGFRSPDAVQAMLINLDEWQPPSENHLTADALRDVLESEAPTLWRVHAYEAEHG